MKKGTSGGYFILSGTFFLVALIWLLGNENRAVGVVWLITGAVELVLGLRARRREKKER